MEALLERAYGVTGLPVTLIPSGAINQNWLVGDRYVLKRYDGLHYSPALIRRTLAAQALAGEAGVPVPVVVANRSGDLLTESEEGSYTLSSYVKGRQYRRGEIPAAAARNMGRTLGLIQNGFAGIRPLEPYSLPDPAARTARIEGLLRQAEVRASHDPVDACACRIFRHKLAEIERLGHMAGWFAGLPVTWGHGDYQETNVIFDEQDRVAAVIDFDNHKCRFRAHEVMRAFAYSFRQGSEESYAYFAGTCETIGELKAEEVALYAPLWAYLHAVALWPTDVRYEAPERYQSRWDRFITPPSDWWSRTMEAVSERLVAIAEATRA